MKTGIVGAGAMGSLFAYFFKRAGISAVIYERNAVAVNRIKSGLYVILGGQRLGIDIEISEKPDVLNACGSVFLFVKSYSTDEAVRNIAPYLSSDCILVTLQNGIGNKDIIAGFIPEERIVYGSTIIGATKVDENTVSHGGSDEVIIGGKNSDSVDKIKALLDLAGLAVTISYSPEEAVWKKAIINAGINPIGALLGIPNGKIIDNEYTRSIQEAVIREAVAVSAAHGLSLDPASLAKAAEDVCAKTAVNLCSMLQDVNARRKTEIDSINGSIVRYGEKYAIDVPVNRTLYGLIKARELLY